MTVPGNLSSPLLATATAAAAAAEYVIPKSLRFNEPDSSYLSRTPSTEGNRRTFTFSCWVKRSKLGSYQGLFGAEQDSSNRLRIEFSNSDTLIIGGKTGGSTTFDLNTTQVFRDCSSFYHLVFAVDTSQSTSSDRIKIYVNGTQVTSFGTETYPSQNHETFVNNTKAHAVGAYGAPDYHLDGLMADVQFVDGLQLLPTDFGETRSSDGVWVPKEFTGFGTNPNNGTTWSSSYSGAFAGNAMTDSALVGSYSGLNSSITITLAESVTVSSSLKLNLYASVANFTNHTTISINGTDQTSNMSLVYSTGTNSGVWEVTGFTGTLSSIGLGAQNGASNGLARVIVDGVTLLNGAVDNSFHLNFSDSSTNEALGFDSAPTTPDPDPKKGMDVITYTGNGGTQNIGGALFEPGLVWVKKRNGTTYHALVDSVRGTNKELAANATDAEATPATAGLTSFNPDGFTTGANSGWNNNNDTFVAWMWRAGGPAVSNTNGSITSQVSVSTDYGFSIVKWTGTAATATIGHGLSSAPKWILVKFTGSTSQWSVYHASIGNTKRLLLNSSNAAATGSTYWNDTSPTSTLFTVGGDLNDSTEIIAYCWSEVSNYSKISSYTGNGSSTGPVVTTGFKVRWLLVKRTDSGTTDNWALYDSERDSVNPNVARLFPNLTNAESTHSGNAVDFLDDGFQPKSTSDGTNASGGNYVYIAFADRPGNNWDVNNIVTNEGLTTSKTQFDVVTYTGNGGEQQIGSYKPSENATVVGGTVSDPGNAFNGSSANWATLTATNTSTAAHVDFAVNLTGITRIEAAYDLSNHGSGDTRGRYNGANAGVRIQSGSGYRDIYNGSAITVTSVGFGINQNSTTGTSYDVVSRFRITDSQGTRFILDGTGPGLKFQPDLIWVKARGSAFAHVLQDSVRGFGSTKLLSSSSTAEENRLTDPTDGGERGYISGTSSTGFTIVDGTGTSQVNGSSETYVAWCWKAGGTAVSNTDGSITSSVSANAQYGFSIVSWTGTGANATVGHGLNNPPGMILVKTRDSAYNWFVYHKGVASDAETDYLRLNTNGPAADLNTAWNDTAPTSSVFSVGTDGSANESGDKMIAYCFANVPGYQRAGQYTGNGSSSGPTVVTGFKPRFLMIKKTSGTGPWYMYDSERDNIGTIDKLLQANDSAAEFTSGANFVAFRDDGFRLKGTGGDTNASGETYIYLAIGDDEIGSDEDCLVDVPNAVTADADATDTTGGYQRGNYCVLNPLDTDSSGKVTLSNGNLTATGNSNRYGFARGTIGVTSGKYYFEATVNGNNAAGIGVCEANAPDQDALGDRLIATAYRNYVYCGSSLQIFIDGSSVYTGSAVGDGDIIGVAVDVDAGKVWFSQNGVYQGSGTQDPGAGAGGYSPTNIDSATPLFQDGGGSPVPIAHFNFGQMRFKYPMPSGYAALNTTALPAATIADGSAQFETTLYTGDGGSSRSVSGINHGVDFAWIKARSAAYSNHLYDSVRGVTKRLRSDQTAAESTKSGVTAFNSDGFTLGSDLNTNENNTTYVAWTWNAGANSNKTYTVKVVSDSGNKYRFDDFGTSAVTLDLAEGSTYVFDQSDSSNSGHPLRFSTTSDGTHGGGSEYTTGVTATGTPGSAGAKTTIVVGSGVATLYYYCSSHSGMGGQANTNSTAGASNFDGNIQSTVKANPEAGFSIVSYTGNNGSSGTVGHGLNAKPGMFIVKNRDTTGDDWVVYHEALGATKRLDLNGTGGPSTNTSQFNDTEPTSSVFTVGSFQNINDNYDYIAYCISPVAGHSAVGQYTGNGSSSGPFVHTGFRVAFILIRRSNSGGAWVIVDNKRDGYNETYKWLEPNTTTAEQSVTPVANVDFLSNGFKLRGNGATTNASGGEYIYWAIAENPFSSNGGLAR